MMDYNKKYSIILNGEFPKSDKLFNQIKSSDFIIATDGSANTLIDNKIIPNIIIGDLDSYKPDKNHDIEVLPVIDQSKTDFQKTLDWCVENKINKLSIFAFSGKSEDHSLGNLFILNEFSDVIDWQAFSDYTIVTPCLGKKRFNSFKEQKVSLFTFEKEAMINSQNLEYKLDNYTLRPSASAVRNISKNDNFTIECKSKLIVFQSIIN